MNLTEDTERLLRTILDTGDPKAFEAFVRERTRRSGGSPDLNKSNAARVLAPLYDQIFPRVKAILKARGYTVSESEPGTYMARPPSGGKDVAFVVRVRMPGVRRGEFWYALSVLGSSRGNPVLVHTYTKKARSPREALRDLSSVLPKGTDVMKATHSSDPEAMVKRLFP